MSEKLFNTIMRGMEEARAYMEGARGGYKVTVSPSMKTKSWAKIREAMPPESQARMDARIREVPETDEAPVMKGSSDCKTVKCM